MKHDHRWAWNLPRGRFDSYASKQSVKAQKESQDENFEHIARQTLVWDLRWHKQQSLK